MPRLAAGRYAGSQSRPATPAGRSIQSLGPLISDLDSLIDLASSRASGNPLLEAPIDEFCSRWSVSLEEFCDSFAHRVATRFVDEDVSFESADAAINRLNGYCLHALGTTPPQFAWQVFLAFDSGEFVHEGDAPDDIPQVKHTLPEIRALLAKARPRGEA